MSGMGRWLAIGSELPCTVIALLLVGQLVGQSVLGPSGATTGALLGAVVGFFLGIYGVYATVRYYDHIEAQSQLKRTYMPSKEEIFEDVKFDIPDDSE
ncbi:MAG: hypothetical protein ACFFED_07415 [Candidatus Thorarchaeota archaeon]